MFYAAHTNGKMFAKAIVKNGEQKPSFYSTYELAEAFQFATAAEAETHAAHVFGKSAGPAVEAALPVITSAVTGLPRPSRHQREEASIHGDHELYT